MSKKELEADLTSGRDTISSGAGLTKESKDSGDLNLEILEQLKQNEKISREILKSLNFIKQHYLWRSIFNFLKVLVIIVVIVFGIVSWRSIVDYITSSLPGNFQERPVYNQDNN